MIIKNKDLIKFRVRSKLIQNIKQKINNYDKKIPDVN